MAREGRAPAFQLYAADFLADHVDWSNAEIGAAMRLRAHQWRYGSLADRPTMMRVARCSARDFERLWSSRLGATFLPMVGGGWGDPELESQRAAVQKYSQEQSNRAKSRWGGDAPALPAASAGGISGRQSSALASSSAASLSEQEIPPGTTIADRPSATIRAGELEPLCHSILGVAFVGNLAVAAERLSLFAALGLGPRESLPRRALEAWRALRAEREPRYRGKLDGFGFLEYWPDIELALQGKGADPVQADGKAPLAIAQLDFGKKGGG